MIPSGKVFWCKKSNAHQTIHWFSYLNFLVQKNEHNMVTAVFKKRCSWKFFRPFLFCDGFSTEFVPECTTCCASSSNQTQSLSKFPTKYSNSCLSYAILLNVIIQTFMSEFTFFVHLSTYFCVDNWASNIYPLIPYSNIWAGFNLVVKGF